MLQWDRKTLESLHGPVQFDEQIELGDDVFSKYPLIVGTQDIRVVGSGFFDSESEMFVVDFRVTGDMICPDAVTNEDILIPLDTESHELYAWEQANDEDDSIRLVAGEVIDLLPAVIDAILLEVPISVTIVSDDDLPSGEGWRVLTEEAYEAEKKQNGDPRLAKLKEFKMDE